MHIQQLLAVSGLVLLGNVGQSLARLDESRVPSQCKDICEPVVNASQKCDRNVPDRETRIECKCTWIQLKTSGTVSDCNRCMHQRHGGNWDKRDDYDDDSDSSDDEDDDMYQSCRGTANGSPATTTMTTSSMTSTMTMEPSATAAGSESSETTGSSSSPSPSSSVSTVNEENGAASLSMSASLATIAGLAIFSWL